MSTTVGSPQEVLQRARELIASQGKPMTTANLNAAMLSLAQAPDGATPEPRFDDVVDASLQGRRASDRSGGTRMTPAHRAPSQAPVRLDAGGDGSVTAEADPATGVRLGAHHVAQDRLQQINPQQVTGQTLRQPGRNDVEADMAANTTDTSANPNAVNARAVGNPAAQTEAPQVSVRGEEIANQPPRQTEVRMPQPVRRPALNSREDLIAAMRDGSLGPTFVPMPAAAASSAARSVGALAQRLRANAQVTPAAGPVAPLAGVPQIPPIPPAAIPAIPAGVTRNGIPAPLQQDMHVLRQRLMQTLNRPLPSFNFQSPASMRMPLAPFR